MPFDDQVDISSDESSSSDAEIGGLAGKQSIDDISIVQPANEIISEEALVLRRAQMYQEYMKELPIPSERGAIIPFYSWTGFGKSTKQLYKQPLHYLTNICLKQLDQNRIGADDEDIHLDTIIHPAKAEVFLWMMEETHRLTTSPHRLATLWLKDSMHKAFIDACVPPP